MWRASVNEDVLLSGMAMKITEEEWFDLEHLNGVFDNSLGVVDLRVEDRTRREPSTVQILPCQATAMAENSQMCSLNVKKGATGDYNGLKGLTRKYMWSRPMQSTIYLFIRISLATRKINSENNCFRRLVPAVDDSLHVQHWYDLEDDLRACILRPNVRAHKIVHEALHNPRRICFTRMHPCCEKYELPLHHGNRVVYGGGRCNGYQRNSVLPGDGDSKRIHSKEDL